MTDLPTIVAAFEQTWQGVVSACTNLTPEQWATPTDLPGWSVKDNVAHIAGEESLLLGEPEPEHELPPGLDHLRHELARAIEVLVDVRRPLPGDEVLREFRSVTARRLAELRTYDEAGLDEEVDFAGRLRPRRDQLGIRAFDCWTHEQDIRRALGHPGGIPSPGASIAFDRLLRSLTQLPSDVPAAAGRSMVVETTGPLPLVATVRFGDDRTYTSGEQPADVRVTTDAETFLRLTTGRVPYDAVASRVTLAGDVDLGVELLRHAAVTP